MTRGSEITLGATTGWVMITTGASVGLIVYALLTLIALLPASSAQDRTAGPAAGIWSVDRLFLATPSNGS